MYCAIIVLLGLILIVATITAVFTILNNEKLKTIMATITQLSAKVDELQEALDTEQQQVSDALAVLNQTVTDLQALITDGGTTEQRQAVLDKINTAITDLKGTVPPAE